MISMSLLEARHRICFREVLCYDKLHIVKLILLFKDTDDLQEPIFLDFFLFHFKPSIAILTTVSKKTFVKYRSNRELFTKRHFRTKCESAKISFAANTLVLGIQSCKHLLISVARGDLCYLSAYNTRL